jgi:hypothetical protein
VTRFGNRISSACELHLNLTVAGSPKSYFVAQAPAIKQLEIRWWGHIQALHQLIAQRCQRKLWSNISGYTMLYILSKIHIQIQLTTSSTAQGGGGSFKNRKPIRAIGCCESLIAERSHWWIKRWLMSPIFLSLFFFSLSLWLSTYLPTDLSIYLSIHSIILSFYHSIILSVYLSICLSIHLSIYLWCSVIQCNVVWCNVVWCSVI